MKKGHVLVLRSCDKDLKSSNGFQWPSEGRVEAPDWDPAAKCGNGLHGFLWGVGDGKLAYWSTDAKWLVVSVPQKSIVDLGGKVKFPSGDVVFCGSRVDAIAYMDARGAADKAVIGATRTAGDGGTATAGYGGTATAGDGGIIQIWWWSASASRLRLAVGYVGEDGILPNVAYRVEGEGVFVPADPTESV